MKEEFSQKKAPGDPLSEVIGRRDQLAVAFALMTVIPMLTLGYFLISYVIPYSLNRESVVFIISLNTLLASMGFIILRSQIRQKSAEIVATNVKLHEQVLELQSVTEKLEHRTTILETLSESSIDGILVVDKKEQTLFVNKRFSEMWKIPTETLAIGNDDKMLEFALGQLKDPDQFIKKVRDLYADEHKKSWDIIELKDGRTFERYSAPVIGTDKTIYGRVWFFRDITSQRDADEALRKNKNQLEALSARLSESQETERKNLAAELHDQIGGILTMLGIDLSVIRDHVTEDNKDATIRVNSAIEQTKNIANHIRDVTFELRPTVLDDYGLQAALKVCCEHFSKHTSITTNVTGKDLNPRLPEVIETALFRTVQEALNNIAKHAQCSKVIVNIDEKDNEISLTVEDNGKGFDVKKEERNEDHFGMGLIMMRERISVAGGALTISSEKDNGTRITAKIKRGTDG